MALSKAATSLLAYLGIYDLTPTEFADDLSNGSKVSWLQVDWFATAVGRVAAGYKPSPSRGIFNTTLQELLDAGY